VNFGKSSVNSEFLLHSMTENW